MAAEHTGESQPFPGPFVRVRGRLSRAGTVRWSPCVRTFREPPQPGQPAEGGATEGEQGQIVIAPGYTVAFESAAGEVLASASTRPHFFSADAAEATFVARLPFESQTARVVLRQDGQELGALVVPPHAPRFILSAPRTPQEIDTEGLLHLRWRRQDGGQPDEPPATYFVRFTDEAAGIQLRPGVNLHTESFDLDLREMPGGDHCVVQVLATNGYHTSYVQTPPFALPARPPSILLGENDGPLLFAQGTSPQYGPLTGPAVTWLVDGTPAEVTGAALDVRSLGAGQHAVSVRVSDPAGRAVTQDLGVYDGASGRLVRPAPGL